MVRLRLMAMAMGQQKATEMRLMAMARLKRRTWTARLKGMVRLMLQMRTAMRKLPMPMAKLMPLTQTVRGRWMPMGMAMMKSQRLAPELMAQIRLELSLRVPVHAMAAE